MKSWYSTRTTMDVNKAIQTYMDHLAKSNYVKGANFLKKQHSLPKRFIDIMCDFALAEINYYDMKFEPQKTALLDRRDNENYLEYVYKSLIRNFGQMQFDISNNDIKNTITSLMQYINVKLVFLGVYKKLKEVGSSDALIDYGELREIMEKIEAKINTPSPVDGILKILHFELDCMKHFIDCNLYLGLALYVDSLLSMKKGTDIMLLWQNMYEERETGIGSMFTNKNALPAMILWFKKFKLLSLAKFTVYFYELLVEQSSCSEVRDVCAENDIQIFNKIRAIQTWSKAQSFVLVYDTGVTPTQKSRTVWGAETNDINLTNKYKILLSYPNFKLDRIDLAVMLSQYNRGRFELDKIDLVVLKKGSYIIIKVDFKITLVMCYASKPKHVKKLKSDIVELISTFRGHKLFSSVNRFKDDCYHV